MEDSSDHQSETVVAGEGGGGGDPSNEGAADSATDDAPSAAAVVDAGPRRYVLPPPPRAAELVAADEMVLGGGGGSKKLYWDRSHYESPAAQMKALEKSSTLYVGNLSFSTRMRHIRAHFGQVGPVKAVHVGLDRMKKTPCGFCFVQYFERRHALSAVRLLSGSKLDHRVIRVELDAGFQPGRQYGRGISGGQVRDDRKRRNDNSGDGRWKRPRSAMSSPSGEAPPPPPSAAGGGETGSDEQENGGGEVDGPRREEDNAQTQDGANGGEDGGEDMMDRDAKRQRIS